MRSCAPPACRLYCLPHQLTGTQRESVPLPPIHASYPFLTTSSYLFPSPSFLFSLSPPSWSCTLVTYIKAALLPCFLPSFRSPRPSRVPLPRLIFFPFPFSSPSLLFFAALFQAHQRLSLRSLSNFVSLDHLRSCRAPNSPVWSSLPAHSGVFVTQIRGAHHKNRLACTEKKVKNE